MVGRRAGERFLRAVEITVRYVHDTARTHITYESVNRYASRLSAQRGGRSQEGGGGPETRGGARTRSQVGPAAPDAIVLVHGTSHWTGRTDWLVQRTGAVGQGGHRRANEHGPHVGVGVPVEAIVAPP